jgi:hypothetical protein
VCYAFIVWLVFVRGGIHEEVWTFEQVDFVGVGGAEVEGSTW